MDVPNRWNSTYELLETALPLKEAFCRLQRIDKQYLLNPSESEWEVATIIHECLHIFYEATSRFSGSKYPTSNVFFRDICKIYLKIIDWGRSEYVFLRSMADLMKQKFDKYWDKCCLVLDVAVVFDPRYKMSLVEYYYIRIYGSSADRYITRVRDTLKDLFFTYGGSHVSSASDRANASSSNTCTDDDDYERWFDLNRGLANQKSEWEGYLDEPRYPKIENFSILDW